MTGLVSGYGPVKAGVEIRQAGLFQLHLVDELAHLQAPVAEVDVAGDGVAHEAEQALQAVADDGRAQVADVHFLGDVPAAEIDHDAARRFDRARARARIGGDLFGALRQGLRPRASR